MHATGRMPRAQVCPTCAQKPSPTGQILPIQFPSNASQNIISAVSILHLRLQNLPCALLFRDVLWKGNEHSNKEMHFRQTKHLSFSRELKCQGRKSLCQDCIFMTARYNGSFIFSFFFSRKRRVATTISRTEF